MSVQNERKMGCGNTERLGGPPLAHHYSGLAFCAFPRKHQGRLSLQVFNLQDKTTTKFADGLARLLKARGLNEFALSKELGLSRTTVYNYTKGRIPSPAILKKIADYFDLTVDDLLNGLICQTPLSQEDFESQLARAPAPTEPEEDSQFDLVTRKNMNALNRLFEFDRIAEKDFTKVLDAFYKLAQSAPPSVRRYFHLIINTLLREVSRRTKTRRIQKSS